MTDVRRGLTTFTVLGLVALALLVLGAMGRLSPVNDAVATIVEPVQSVIAPMASGLRGFGARLAPGGDLRAENGRLRAEVDRLTAENIRLRQLEQENTQLRQRLGFTADHPELPLLNAGVIGRDPASLRQYIVIDRGTDDGIAPGMAVVHPSGALIGQVYRADAGRSEVLLITDIESAVNAEVQRTRAGGIVEGQWQKGELLRMRYVEQGPAASGQPRIRTGDWIVTSGLGGTLPRGLLIGRVDTVTQVDAELEQQARVLPAVDVRAVDSVLVVTSP